MCMRGHRTCGILVTTCRQRTCLCNGALQIFRNWGLKDIEALLWEGPKICYSASSSLAVLAKRTPILYSVLNAVLPRIERTCKNTQSTGNKALSRSASCNTTPEFFRCLHTASPYSAQRVARSTGPC